MTKIVMKSWRKGLKKISLANAIKEYSTYDDLVDAKAAVDHLLDGEAVTLEFISEEAKTEFRNVAEPLGVIFESY